MHVCFTHVWRLEDNSSCHSQEQSTIFFLRYGHSPGLELTKEPAGLRDPAASASPSLRLHACAITFLRVLRKSDSGPTACKHCAS